MYRRILTALDWTAGTEAVLDQTRRLAMLTGATVHVLHVHAMSLPIPRSTLGYLATQALITEPTARGASDVAHRMVDDAVAALAASGVRAVGLLLESMPENTAQAVLDQAIGLDIELIILGSRRRGRPCAIFRPNVTEELARHARCPILIVPDEAGRSGVPRDPGHAGLRTRSRGDADAGTDADQAATRTHGGGRRADPETIGDRHPAPHPPARLIGFHDKAFLDFSFPDDGVAGFLEWVALSGRMQAMTWMGVAALCRRRRVDPRTH